MKRVSIPVLGLFVSLQLTGCIFLALQPTGASLEDIEKLALGVSTRKEVHRALGKPDVVITDRYEIINYVLAEYRPDGVLHDLRWERYDEVLSRKPVPNLTWPDTLQWAGYSPLQGSVTVTINPSRNGRLLVVSDTSTDSIVLYDGQSGNLDARIEAVAGCHPLGIRPRDWSRFRLNRVRVNNLIAFPARTVFLGDDAFLASIAEEDTICIWNAHTETRIRELSGTRGIWGIVAARSAAIIASIDAEGIVDIWNGSDGSKISSIAVCGGICWDLRMALSDDGQILATAQQHFEPGSFIVPDSVNVRLWDAKTGAELVAFTTFYSRWLQIKTPEIALSPDLRQVALVRDWHAEVWRIDQRAELVRRDDVPANAAGWSVELEQVMMLPFVGWPFAGPPAINAVPYVAFSADGRKLAAGYGSAAVWEVETWREVWRAPSLYSEARRAFGDGFVFTSDGRHIITQCCSWEVPELDE